jgi:hypothetical protein
MGLCLRKSTKQVANSRPPLRRTLGWCLDITTGFDVSSHLHWYGLLSARSRNISKRNSTERPSGLAPSLNSCYPTVGTSPPALTLVLTFIDLSPLARSRTALKRSSTTQRIGAAIKNLRHPPVEISPPALTLVLTFIGLAPFSAK